jgi:hypothetical protein
MRVSYEGFEEEASDLFAAIESRHKGKNIFFDKSICYNKKRKGAQPLVHWGYTKGTRGRKKIRKENLQSLWPSGQASL